MTEHTEHRHILHGSAGRLRSPERLARLQVPEVVRLCLEGIAARDALDVGTGAGVFAEGLALAGLRVAGVDPNAEMLQMARAWVPTGDFCTGTAEALPYPDDAFDLVFLGHVLHETDRPMEALREARRVARLRVAVLEWAYREEAWGPPLAHRLAPERIVALAEQAGLPQMQRTDMAHAVLYRSDLPREQDLAREAQPRS